MLSKQQIDGRLKITKTTQPTKAQEHIVGHPVESQPVPTFISSGILIAVVGQELLPDLKEGDRVDALDGRGKWQTATVVCREHRSEAELEGGMPMVKIGWRTYHPEGDKKDEMGHYWALSC